MKPDKEGIWEWFDEDGNKRLVSVCNVAAKLGEVYLRVYWWGGYYSIEADERRAAEWPDRWGNYIGPEDCVPESQKYWMPTPEEREKIMKQARQ